MKADGLLLATLALTSCLTREAIVVAPTPAVRTDSLARASFARSAMDLPGGEGVLREGHFRFVRVDAFGERRVRECSSHGSVCPRPAQIDSAASRRRRLTNRASSGIAIDCGAGLASRV